MTRAVARDAARAALAPWEQRTARVAKTNTDKYALDPLLHLHEGHVKILDLVTLDEVTFEPYEHQEELARAWIDFDHLVRTGQPVWRNVHEEKSRQMGVTWILAWLELWAVSYHEFPGLVMHLNYTEVDDGGSNSTTDSFFGKIRYMHGRLPEEHRAPIDFKYGLISHRYRGERAYITAEGATGDPGRGGRYKRGIIDEAAKLPFGEAAHQALSRAIPVGRIYNSTPFGRGNVYYRLRDERPAGYEFLSHHWSEHPVYGLGAHAAGSRPSKCEGCAGNKAGVRWDPQHPTRAHRYPGKITSPWYDHAVVELTDTQVAQELDIDYTASLTGRVYPEFDWNVHVVEEGIPLDVNLGIDLMWDYGIDVTSVIVAQDAPDELRVIGILEMGEEINGEPATPDAVAPALVEYLSDLGMPMKLLTTDWTLQMRSVGDPAGEGREQSTGRPLKNAYRRQGFAIKAPKRYTIAQTVTAAKRLLLGRPKPMRVCGRNAQAFAEHMALNRWPTDRHGMRTQAVRPLDDEHNHAARAFAYYCAFRWPPPDTVDVIAPVVPGGPRRAQVVVGSSLMRERERIGIKPGMKL